MSLREDLIRICHKVYEQGYVSAYDGNISAATPDNTFLITRSGVNKGEVTDQDILEIDVTGKVLKGEGKVSTEYKLHFFAYSRRKEVNAIVHCHPVFTTAFSTAGEELPHYVFPEVILTLGKVPLCKYATPSTEELPKSLMPYIDFAWAFMLQNHGAVTLGKNLEDAYYKMEKLEHSAKILFFAKMLGKVNPLSSDQINELISIAESAYGIKTDVKKIK
ncbi:MAG TPA: class II aldolase/adducin family protein [Ignavibacteriaceae bacterium]|nr:class II aldolase/adducin family protein [Ignavibacteriaceae bacterium]